MSVSYSATLVFGIPFQQSDIWETVPYPPQCPSHGTQSTPFCAQCGAKVVGGTKLVAKPAFAAYSKKVDMDPDDVWEELREYRPSSDTRPGLFASPDNKPGEWVLGVNIAGMSSYNMRKPGVSAGALDGHDQTVGEVLAMAEAMGITDLRTIKIFLYLDAG